MRSICLPGTNNMAVRAHHTTRRRPIHLASRFPGYPTTAHLPPASPLALHTPRQTQPMDTNSASQPPPCILCRHAYSVNAGCHQGRSVAATPSPLHAYTLQSGELHRPDTRDGRHPAGQDTVQLMPPGRKANPRSADRLAGATHTPMDTTP